VSNLVRKKLNTNQPPPQTNRPSLSENNAIQFNCEQKYPNCHVINHYQPTAAFFLAWRGGGVCGALWRQLYSIQISFCCGLSFFTTVRGGQNSRLGFFSVPFAIFFFASCMLLFFSFLFLNLFKIFTMLLVLPVYPPPFSFFFFC